MKKTISLLICLSVASLCAKPQAELSYFFIEDYNFEITYKNYNIKDDLVYGARFQYYATDPEKYGYTKQDVKINNYQISADIGKNIILNDNSDSAFGINLLTGLEWWKTNQKHKVLKQENKLSDIGIRLTIDTNGIYEKNIIYDLGAVYTIYFGDFDGHSLRATINAGYKFTPNLYAKAGINFYTQGKDIEKNTQTGTSLGFKIGYEF